MTYTVTYSGENAITLANGNVTLNTTGTASATVGVSGSGSTRTVTLSSITGNGTLGISIASGTASDTAGNTSSGAGPSTTFTVDNTAPVVSVPADITTPATSSGGRVVTFTTSALDAVDGSRPTTATPASGSLFAIGTTTVNVSSTDLAGNTGTASFTVTVAPSSPTVANPTSSAVTATGATLGGEITADGFAAITERGVVYSETTANNDPLISGVGVTKVVEGATTTGVFTAAVTGLTASTGYSYKAYAINSAGTSYSAVDTFTTPAPNHAPTDIALSNAAIAENNTAGATVGTLSATDADAGDTFTFSLVSGTGDTDNASFGITGTALTLTGVANFEVKNSYSVRVRVTDAGGLTFEKPFTIGITDVNEPPVPGVDGIARLDNTTQAKVKQSVLLANDTDPEGDPRTIISVSNAQPPGSAVGILGSFVIYFSPANNSGDGSFDYTLSDGHGHTVSATVTVTQVVVPPPAQAPNAASVTMVGSDVVLSYVGVPGNQYRIQYTTSTGPTYVWQEFNPLAVYTAPASGVFTHTDVNPTGPVRLYRAIPHP